MGTTAALFVFGVIDAEQAFSGFSNLAPITVAGLYIVAEGISKTGALEPFLRVALGDSRGPRATGARLVVPSAAASAFVANTPIVAMLVPEVTRWADARRFSASRVLIPLSYATILGGTLTVIGTSTNLVMSGLLVESGQDSLSLFELAPISAPVVAVGLFVIIMLGPRVMPERRRPRAQAEATERPFTVAMRVIADGPLDTTTVTEAGLRHLDGVFLVEIRRAEKLITPVNPDQTLRANDILIFAGQVDSVVDLQSKRGLESASGDPMQFVEHDRDHGFFEAVVGAASPLAGRTLADVEFRSRYQASVVGVHRAGELVRAKLGEVQLQAGDTLLLLAGRDFSTNWRDQQDFLLVSPLDGPDLRASSKAPIAALALAVVAIPPLLDVWSVTRSTVLACGLLVVARVLTPSETRDAVDLNVVIMIAGSFGLGAAVQTTGLADEIASVISSSTSWMGDYGVVVGLLLSTMILTELVTNAAAVALIFPTAVSVAGNLGVEPRTMLIGVAVAASASFLTPIGYQTNTMVYGPGGYRFSDYLRLGLPLSLVTVVGVSAMVMLLG